jgi:hypothetical protein
MRSPKPLKKFLALFHEENFFRDDEDLGKSLAGIFLLIAVK